MRAVLTLALLLVLLACALRVGTREDLLAGRWLRREELRTARVATFRVEIEL